MSTGWLDNSFLLLLGAAGVWFFIRFILGPRRGAPSFGSFFKREGAEKVDGLGQRAIETLINDTRTFVEGEEALRGLLLAGAFAVRAGTPQTSVVFIALCDAPERYTEPDWLLRWAYPARGHKVLEQDAQREPGHVGHSLRLRGAPPVAVHFVASDRAAPPEALKSMLNMGCMTLEDPTGQAERLRRRWESLLRPGRTVAAERNETNKNTEEDLK